MAEQSFAATPRNRFHILSGQAFNSIILTGLDPVFYDELRTNADAGAALRQIEITIIEIHAPNRQ